MQSKTRLICCFAALFAPAAAFAGVTAKLDETLGTDKYRGTSGKVSVDVGNELYIEPGFNVYRSDTSSGTYKTISARLGYDSDPVSAGFNVGGSPKTNGYSNAFLGGDFTFTLSPTHQKRKLAGPRSDQGAFGSGLARIDLGGAFNITGHRDDFQVQSTTQRNRVVQRNGTLAVRQTDLSAFAGLIFFVVEGNAEITKSVYDKDLNAVLARRGQILELAGVNSIIQGFPDTSFNASVKWTAFPLVKPYVSYTHTTFKLGESPSNAYTLGAALGLQMVQVRASFERYAQSGFQSKNYVSFGGSLFF